MQFKKPELNAKKRRLAAALTIGDLRAIAKRRTPEGRLRLHRRRRRGRDLAGPRPAGVPGHRVPPGDPARRRRTSTPAARCSAARSALPFGIAPTGFTRMMQTEGEIAGAAAAAAAGIPFSPVHHGHHLDRGRRGRQPARPQLVPALHVEGPRPVDGTGRPRRRGRATTPCWSRSTSPSPGARLRDVRNGMTIPPHADPAHRRSTRSRGPAWWINFLTTEPLAFASLDRWSGTVAELLDTMFDPTVTFEDLAWIREQWPGKLVVKGVQTVADAREARRPRRRRRSCCPTTAAASSTAPRSRSTCCPRSSREVGKDLEVHARHRHHVRRRHRRRDRPRRPVHPDRPRLPLRPDGRRPDGRRPRDRDPARPGRAHHAAARRQHPRRARARATSPSWSAWRPRVRTAMHSERRASEPLKS